MTEDTPVSKKNLFPQIILWTARIMGGLVIIYSLIMIVYSLQGGDNKNASFSPGAWDGTMIWTGVCFLIGIAGLITAYMLEGEGGLIALIGMTAFLILTKQNPQAIFSYHYYLLLLPSLLYMWYWWLEKRGRAFDTE